MRQLAPAPGFFSPDFIVPPWKDRRVRLRVAQGVPAFALSSAINLYASPGPLC